MWGLEDRPTVKKKETRTKAIMVGNSGRCRKHRSLAVSNSSNSLAISHLNGSLAKLATAEGFTGKKTVTIKIKSKEYTSKRVIAPPQGLARLGNLRRLGGRRLGR